MRSLFKRKTTISKETSTKPFASYEEPRCCIGLGHDYVTEFSYHNGYYDGIEKEFRGFENAEQIEIGDESQPTLVSAYTFDTGRETESLKGRPLRVIRMTEDGKIFDEDENTGETRSLFEVLPAPDNPLHPDGVSFAYMSGTLQTVREEPSEATQPVTLEKEFKYDDYGNQVMAANYGRVQGSDCGFGNNERVTWSVFSATPEYPIWSLPVEVVVSNNDTPPRVYSHTRFYCDGNSFLGGNLSSIGAGNPMRHSEWVGPQNLAEPPAPLPPPPFRFLSVSEQSNHRLVVRQHRDGL